MNGETGSLMVKHAELFLHYHIKPRFVCFSGTMMIIYSYANGSCLFNRLSGQIMIAKRW